MNKINTGYNFDLGLIDAFQDLNNKYPDQITGVYGSIRAHAWTSARPDFRLPEVSIEELADHVRMLGNIGIEFNYTLNSPYLGSKVEYAKREDELADIITLLSQIGVARIIIANPIVLETMRRKLPNLPIKIELSTILHVDTPMQLVAFKQIDERIDKVVGNILYNRDFNKLEAFARTCEMLDMEYEVMVNEFCSIASKRSEVPNFAHCIHRDSCYNCHAKNVAVEDAKLINNYPMGKCMSGRAHHAADWLRSPFILPQHMHYYNNVGIDNFKVTGRTAKTPYIKYIVESYLKQQYNDNLMKLWKPLETIYSDKDELSEHKFKFDIPTEHMDDFLAPWVARELDCNMQLCSDCQYCDRFAVENLGV